MIESTTHRTERIQNRRRQKQVDKKKEDKDLIRLWKKYDRLWASKRAYELVALEKPIRSGYKRSFVLRPDIARSREAHVYNELLKLIQNTIVCNKKDFTYKDWKTKLLKPIQQELSDIPLDKWNKLGLTAKQKSFFEKVWRTVYSYNGKTIGGYWVYVFKDNWMFVLKREPFYITHRVVVDAQLESEIKEVMNKIDMNNLWPKIYSSRSRSYNYRDYDKDRIILMENRAIMKNQMIDLMYMNDFMMSDDDY